MVQLYKYINLILTASSRPTKVLLGKVLLIFVSHLLELTQFKGIISWSQNPDTAISLLQAGDWWMELPQWGKLKRIWKMHLRSKWVCKGKAVFWRQKKGEQLFLKFINNKRVLFWLRVSYVTTLLKPFWLSFLLGKVFIQ